MKTMKSYMINIEDVEKSLKHFGLFQGIVMLFVFISWVYIGQQMGGTVFVMAKQEYYCSDGENSSMSSADTNTTNFCLSNSCSNWTFRSDSFITIRSEYNLVCDQELWVPLCASLLFAGNAMGAPVFGYISDRLGRVRSSIFGVVVSACMSVLCAWSTSFSLYMVARFLLGFTLGWAQVTTLTYGSEVVGRRQRAHLTMIACQGFTIGLLIEAVIAYFQPYHRVMQLISTYPAGVLLFMLLLLPESPRWLASKGKHQEAKRSIRLIEKVNRQKPSASEEEAVMGQIEDITCAAPLTEEEEAATSSSSTPFGRALCQHKTLLRSALIVWLYAFFSNMGYYSLTIGVENISEDIFINYIIICGADIPGNAALSTANRKTGRRFLACTSAVVSGILCCLVGFLIGQVKHVIVISISAIAKLIVDISFAMGILYGAEIFPTTLRSAGSGITYAFGRTGSVLAPLGSILHSMWPPGMFLLYGVPLIFLGVLSLWLPETRHWRLPQNAQESNAFSKRSKSSGCAMLNCAGGSAGDSEQV